MCLKSTSFISSSTSFWYQFFHFRLTYSFTHYSFFWFTICSSIAPSFFHSRLKTYLFHKSYSRSFTSFSRTVFKDLCPDPFLLSYSVFSKRQRITLRLLYAMSPPSVCLSVCRLSVTLVHPTQAVELFGNFFSPYDSSGTLLSWRQKSLVGDAPFPSEICVQSDPPPFKQRNFDKYRLIAP